MAKLGEGEGGCVVASVAVAQSAAISIPERVCGRAWPVCCVLASGRGFQRLAQSDASSACNRNTRAHAFSYTLTLMVPVCGCDLVNTRASLCIHTNPHGACVELALVVPLLFSEDYSGWRGGAPDLLLWRPEHGDARVSEGRSLGGYVGMGSVCARGSPHAEVKVRRARAESVQGDTRVSPGHLRSSMTMGRRTCQARSAGKEVTSIKVQGKEVTLISVECAHEKCVYLAHHEGWEATPDFQVAVHMPELKEASIYLFLAASVFLQHLGLCSERLASFKQHADTLFHALKGRAPITNCEQNISGCGL
eukprot:1143894-Pelagomonas_calceolata.AAC.12